MKHSTCPRDIAVMAALLMCISIPVFAQRGQTSAMTGDIRDTTDQPLGGVTVTIGSPQLIGGLQTVSSDVDGRYRFSALAPGSYTLTAALPGFETVQRPGIHLLAGMGLTVDLVLNVAPVDTTVEVRAVVPTIDVRSSASQMVIERPILENLPVLNRSVTDYLNLAPGVSNGVALGGAAGTNPISVDGTNGTDPQVGRPDAQPVVNWLESLQVVSVGANAEHGEYTSARLNAITRSGANRFSGLGEYWWTRSQWAKWAELLAWRNISGQVGGPIARDRVWFFAGAEYHKNAWRPGGYVNRPRLPDEPQAILREDKLLLKLTTAPSKTTRLEGYLEREDSESLNGNATPLTQPEALASRDAPQRLQNLRFTWTLSDRTLVEARYGRFWGHLVLGPSSPERRSGPPPHRDQATGAFSGNAPTLSDLERSVHGARATLTRYVTGTGPGQHELKFGLEHERARLRQHIGYPGNTFYLDRDGAPELVRFWEGATYRPSHHRTSVFVQDSWQHGRLTLEPGLRLGYYNSDLPDTTARLYSNQSISPRLGAAWDLSPDHSTVIRAHYGHYHDAMATGFYEYLDPQADTIFSVARVVGPNQFEEVTRSGGTGTANIVIDPDAKHSFAEEWFAGVEHEVWPRLSIKAEYIRRNTRNALGFVDTGSTWTPVNGVDPGPDGREGTGDDGGPLTIYYNYRPEDAFFVMTNPPGAWRRYDALQVVGSRRPADGWSVQASYTWARTEGSFDNETSSNAANTDLAPNGNFANPNRAINTIGRTVFDRRHDVRVFGTYTLPYWGGLRVSGIYRYTSGVPWGREVNSFSPLTGAMVLVEPVGTRQLPAMQEMDLRVEKTFHVRAGSVVGLYADIFNVTNRVVAARVNQSSGSSFERVQNWTQPRRFRAGVRVTF